VLLGQFRCPPQDPEFRVAGRITNYVVAFPRTAVWIRHEGEASFVADPAVATVFNPYQPYERGCISREGDCSDWLAVSEPIAREIVEVVDPPALERDRPFRIAYAPVSSALYLRQRRLFDRATSGELIEPLEAEEEVVSIVGDTLSSGLQRAAGDVARGSRPRARRLVQDARRLLMATLFENLTLGQLVRELRTSVFHLCRTFRRGTGMTVHEYRRAMRLRIALELAPRYRGNLSALALRCGFYSHSHFSAAFRKSFGVLPSAFTDVACRPEKS
jgi:AraC-like DNA-binding protein